MIDSLEQYRASEKKLQELLASFGSAGDLVGQHQITGEGGNWQNVTQRIKDLKDEMKAYRDAHPEEFTS